MLHRLSMSHFRNYSAITLPFFKGINVFIGSNGSGKTNLLEAIHFLCQLKSFRPVNVEDMLSFDSEVCHLSAKIDTGGKMERIMSLSYEKDSKKKSISVDGEKISLKSYLNLQKCLFISNEDILTTTQSMTYRRDVFNEIISMISDEYRASLMVYQKLLKKRNDLLKNEKISNELDMQVAFSGLKIMRARKNIVSILGDRFSEIYKKLLGVELRAFIKFESGLLNFEVEDYLKQLQKNKKLDLLTKRTNFGAHKEEIQFFIGDRELKKVGSQAQIKLYVYAFKLAVYEYSKMKFKKPFILLMDDVFADLDPLRIEALLDFIKDAEQLFLTCANFDLVKPYVNEAHFYKIDQGEVSYDER